VGTLPAARAGPARDGGNLSARLGYAVPGGVIAVGLLVPFAAFDNCARRVHGGDWFGISTGLLITGSIWLLVVAYMVRFLAAAHRRLRGRAGHGARQHGCRGAVAGRRGLGHLAARAPADC
jgi:ABC-type Fe3+ transport system permease subunit